MDDHSVFSSVFSSRNSVFQINQQVSKNKKIFKVNTKARNLRLCFLSPGTFRRGEFLTIIIVARDIKAAPGHSGNDMVIT